LMAWAAAAQKAHEIASILCETSFVPKSMAHRPGEVTGAILTGMELGVPIMWALNNIDLIDGSPAIRAKGLRALALRHGHEMWTEETTSTRAIVCGRRKGTARVERSTWTMDRAKKAGLAGKKTWLAYPNDMLLNRATAEVVRLIAPDALIGVSHTIDEMGGDETPGPLLASAEEREEASPPAKRRTVQRRPEPAEVAPPPDMPDPPIDPPPDTCDTNMPHDPQYGSPYGCPPRCPTRLVPRVVTEADAAAIMGAAGFEVMDVMDVIDNLGEPADQQQDDQQEATTPPEPTPDANAEPAPPNGDDDPSDPGGQPMTMPQRKRIGAEMRRAGLTERGERLSFVVDAIGRHIESSNELTVREASAVIQALADLDNTINEGLRRAEAAKHQRSTDVGDIE